MAFIKLISLVVLVVTISNASIVDHHHPFITGPALGFAAPPGYPVPLPAPVFSPPYLPSQILPPPVLPPPVLQPPVLPPPSIGLAPPIFPTAQFYPGSFFPPPPPVAAPPALQAPLYPPPFSFNDPFAFAPTYRAIPGPITKTHHVSVGFAYPQLAFAKQFAPPHSHIHHLSGNFAAAPVPAHLHATLPIPHHHHHRHLFS